MIPTNIGYVITVTRLSQLQLMLVIRVIFQTQMTDKEKAQKELENLIKQLSHRGFDWVDCRTPNTQAQYYERDAALRKKLKTVIKVIDEIHD